MPTWAEIIDAVQTLGFPSVIAFFFLYGGYKGFRYLAHWGFREPDLNKNDPGGWVTRFFDETIEANRTNKETLQGLNATMERQNANLEKQTELHEMSQEALKNIEKTVSVVHEVAKVTVPCKWQPFVCMARDCNYHEVKPADHVVHSKEQQKVKVQ